ncbi:hypothetical protein CMV_018658 [Castanea mollissima]|uniref:Uncharacterized protein n=1 Tax=Castanea mollissima TaxID=60419 RepID=A0A8J4QZN3_9ROSI|nr:hypothetical protein CMV_018658 [Castanea mollissima]
MEKPTMLPWIKIFILILLLVPVCSSSGRANSFNDGTEQTYQPREVIIQMKIRKLIGADAMLDYTDPGPNPIHEPPKKGSPGGRVPAS